MKDDTGTKTRKQAERERLPFGWDWLTWFTKNKGHVVRLGGLKCYSNRCCVCGDLIIVRRKVGWFTGRWPSYCRACFAAREAAHDSRAVHRVHKVRAEQRTFRDEQRRKFGLPVPDGTPGRPKGSPNFR